MTDIDSDKAARLCKSISKLLDEAKPNNDEAVVVALTIFTAVCSATAETEGEVLEDCFDGMVMAAATVLGLDDEGDLEFTETLQ